MKNNCLFSVSVTKRANRLSDSYKFTHLNFVFMTVSREENCICNVLNELSICAADVTDDYTFSNVLTYLMGICMSPKLRRKSNKE